MGRSFSLLLSSSHKREESAKEPENVVTSISLPAGIARTEIKKFSLYTTLGSFPWYFALAYVGFLLRPQRAIIERLFRYFDIVVKRYGSTIGKDIHPHTFRHSYAIHCVRNGWAIRRLQQVLGHSSLNVTAKYLQFND